MLFVVAVACSTALACGTPPPARTEVAVAPLAETHGVDSVGERASCVVTGSGEATIAGAHADFVLYDGRTSDVPLARVVSSHEVAGAWNEFPSGSRGERARFVTGNGKMPIARIAGWTPLRGRGFTTRRDTIVVPSHVWLVGGVVVEITGARAGGLVVQRPSNWLAEPKLVSAHAQCADVAYESYVEAEVSVELPAATRQAADGRVALRAAPGAAVVFTIATNDSRIVLVADAPAGGWVHVRGALDVLRFDGWVAESETAALAGSGHGRLGGSHTTRAPTIRGGQPMSARIETALYLGKTPEDARAIGVLEIQARLDVMGRGKRAEVRFSPMVLIAPEGMGFYVDEADLTPAY